MNTSKSKALMAIDRSKKKSCSQIAAIGRKYKMLRYPILLFLVLFIFIYNFAYYFCLYFKMRERTAKAVAMAMCVIICVTSIDITAFAFSKGSSQDKKIVGINSLSDEIAKQKVDKDATLDDIELPESFDVHVTYQVEKEIEVEEESQGEEVNALEEIKGEESGESETNVSGDEPTKEGNQSDDTQSDDTQSDDKQSDDTQSDDAQSDDTQSDDAQSDDTQSDDAQSDNVQSDDAQSDDTQNDNTESQPDEEQTAKITYSEYDNIATVCVPMKYYAAEPSEEEVITLEKGDATDEGAESEADTKSETVVEDVEEDVAVSVEWSIDEENSSKTEFLDLEVGEKYVFVPTITENGYKLADDVELPSITVTVEEIPTTFEQSVTVDGVVINVTADEGVFPKGATIEARKVTTIEEDEVAEAIDEVREEEKNVAASYTFDITIYDKDGNEIEPDTEKGSVKVTFKMEEIANENLMTEVYHVEETDEGLNAEGLDVDTEADEAAVETTGFSFYTVEFTYGELQYVLEGDEKVELSTILDAVGIKENGAINKVEGSNDELFKPILEGNIWYIEAKNAFDTKEKLIVTIGSVAYVIDVTDANYVASFTINGSTTNYESFTDAVKAANASAGGGVIKLLQDTSTEAFRITKNTTLNLNGKKLTTTTTYDYIGGRKSAITVGPNVNMTIEGGGTITTQKLEGICFVLVTASGSECHVEKDVYIQADVHEDPDVVQLRVINANTNSKIYFKDAKVEAVNALPTTQLAILVAWEGEIFIDGGEYIWGNNHTDWSGVLDSVNKITIYDGKFNGRIWYSNNGTYAIYGGEFSQADIYSGSNTSKPWGNYISGATVTDMGAGTTYRYKVTVPKCTINTEENSTYAGTASATPSSLGKSGDKITVKATPKDGYKFVNWEGDASAYGTTNPIVKTIQSGDINKTYTYKANFALAGTPVPSAKDIKNTSMTISWNAVTAATGYDLYVSTDSSCNGSYVQGYGPLSGTATSVSVTGLDINTKYYYKVVAKAPDNLTSSSQIGNAVTQKGIAVVTKAPQPKTLVYTGNPLELIEAGSAEHGTMNYVVGTDSSVAPDSGWNTAIPTGKNAGIYYVWYKVAGDANHEDSEPQEVKATIGKAECSYTAPKALALKFTGGAQELVEAGTTNDGNFQYSLKKDDDYSDAIPTAINKGEYKVWYKIVGDSNHINVEPHSISAAIDKNVRNTVSVSMSNYTYEQEEAIPTPVTNPKKGELYETPKITYYYNTTNSNVDGTEWKNINATSLNAGTYYMYAVVEETDSYLEYVTVAKPFTVNKSTVYTATPPTGKLTYGQTIEEAILKGGSASKQGDFAWTDATKDIMPKVADSDLTEYEMVFTQVAMMHLIMHRLRLRLR